MRKAFHADLDQILDQLVGMTRLASSSMSRATTALLDADVLIAESVIDADKRITEVREDIDARAIELLARQQPVATDLRLLVTAMQMSSEIERMGDLARHVAKIARLRHPASAVPSELRAIVLQMGHVAERIVERAGSIIAAKDATGALALEQDDDAMDDLQRELLSMVLKDTGQYGTETAVDMTLLARYYERYADHAVAVAGRISYLVTGQSISQADIDREDLEDRMRVASNDPAH